ncbi:unnamed protein product [Adineta ricciae]|uniref:ADP ribosyltransferase domain-containing protein n=1 Tax=Adineta ricciae TaxID=249248 RepID=A0A815YZ68_ADIRI|nr:unnamed protein product [Adineta ricciae]CAF1575982.1 unnamed protein product [Adineta ricciae]
MGSSSSSSYPSNKTDLRSRSTAIDDNIAVNNSSTNYDVENNCPHGNRCAIFQRLSDKGYDKNDIDHCSKYFHPGRRGGTTIAENFGSKKFITAYQNWGVDLPKGVGLWNGVVKEGDLIRELEQNGFGAVMVVSSKPSKTLDHVAQKKLNDPRHKEMGSPLSHDQMLAIILYTDSDVYKDLRHHEMCYSQQDFANTKPCDLMQKKWPILGCLLNSAIWVLDQHDKRPRPKVVYHGLCGIEVDPLVFNNHNATKRNSATTGPVFRYGTFISTSWNKEVALEFMNKKGSLLEISLEEEHMDALVGADVSWISKYQTEYEFLIARGATFVIQSMPSNKQDPCQIVKIKQGPVSHNRTKFRRLYS